MPHITVQLGPCCTVPFSSGIPSDPLGAWEAPTRIIPTETNETAYLRERALKRQPARIVVRALVALLRTLSVLNRGGSITRPCLSKRIVRAVAASGLVALLAA